MGERLVVIGGDAGGMAAASQARRLRGDLDIVALERGPHTSYSACGIPYLVGGEVGAVADLVVRTPQEHRDRSRIDVRTRHEAVGIDLGSRRVEVRDLERGRTFSLGFDHLMLGLGARPRRPPLPGIDGHSVHGVQTLADATALLSYAERTPCQDVVVVGGGYIGLEMAEAFARRGSAVVVVERGPQVMGTLDPDMGALVSAAMRSHGIEVRCGTIVEAFEDGVVHTGAGDLPADLVILGMGVEPNVELAADAGVALGDSGAIAVDRRQRTSAEGVWAAGDCCEVRHLVSGRSTHVALGTVANKAARVAGTNIGGGYATFDGVVGTAAVQVCATEVARTGLTEAEATRDGFEHHAVTVDSTTSAGYLPGASPITVKLVAEQGSGRLLGAQIVGKSGAAKRIDVVATALHARMTVEAMTQLDLAYAPPFSPVWDPVLIAARKAAQAVAEASSS
ncbi:MAG TPA: FAD-dependent oxidoreductase [Acidimicrobiales bacterium]|nr:FAD-dependent oxidoreductase [Acidimicrobiales bacterium]